MLAMGLSLCCGKFLIYLFCFIMKGYWIFTKPFSFYWDEHLVCISFFTVVYHIDWFLYIEPSLYPKDKYHLILAYDFLNVLLNSFASILPNVSVVLLVSDFSCSVFGFGIRVMLVWVWECLDFICFERELIFLEYVV